MRNAAVLLAGVACCMASAAAAQDTASAPGTPADTPPATPAAQQATASDAALGDIIVTAQRREQTLREVPVSVAVIGADALREQRITTVADLSTAVPNLTVSASPFQPFVAIRGLGSGAASRALEQSVATYVDGIYAGRPNQFLNPYFDVERVEVVRGPQGVLFGVNANAGGINIVNKKADSGMFEGYATAGYEFANQGYNVEGAVSVPITADLGIRVAGRVGRDGAYLRNLVNNRDVPTTDHRIVRATLSWRPDGDLKVDLGYEYSHNRRDGNLFQNAKIYPGVFGTIEDGDVDFDVTYPAGRANYTRTTSQNVILNASYQIGAHVLSSSSGYSVLDFSQAMTPPGTAFLGTAVANEKFRQFYQEVRLTSPSHQPFEYILGATYLHQRDRIPQGYDIDLSFFGASGVLAAIRTNFDLTNETLAAFGQGTYHFDDRLSVTGGVRYSTVKKDVDYLISASDFGAPLTGYAFNPTSAVLNRNFGWMLYVDPAVPATVRPTSITRGRRFNAWNPSASINYEVSDRLSVYASFNTGTKAGGFNDQEKSGLLPENGAALDPFEFNSEQAKNYEAGVKFAGRHARFEAALFHTTYDDMQVSQAISGGTVTSNAASAHANGVELGGQLLLARGFTVSGDFAYIDAKYDNFPGVGCIPSPVPTTCDPVAANARGGKLTGLPKITGSINPAYETNLSDQLKLRVFGRAYYNDGAQWSPTQDPNTRTPSYWTFDAGATIGQIDKGWSLSVTARNLTNEVVQGYLLPWLVPAGGYQVIVSPGRQVFMDIRFSF